MQAPEHQHFSTLKTLRAAAPIETDILRMVVRDLLLTEEQASALVKLFLFPETSPKTTEGLLEILHSQPINMVDLRLVMAYLAGFMGCHSWRSEFDEKTFGGIISSGKDQAVYNAFVALTKLMAEKGLVSIDRPAEVMEQIPKT